MAQLGIVIRANGTIPFDEGFHPEHQALVLGHLLSTGHVLEKHPETGEWKVTSGPLLEPAAIE